MICLFIVVLNKLFEYETLHFKFIKIHFIIFLENHFHLLFLISRSTGRPVRCFITGAAEPLKRWCGKIENKMALTMDEFQKHFLLYIL